jgi:hypothetical protein
MLSTETSYIPDATILVDCPAKHAKKTCGSVYSLEHVDPSHVARVNEHDRELHDPEYHEC